MYTYITYNICVMYNFLFTLLRTFKNLQLSNTVLSHGTRISTQCVRPGGEGIRDG